MRKCFYLICPTDSIESTINKTFKSENYFYTSLGNSFLSNKKIVTYIQEMLVSHNIRDIYFVLSMDNQIILDAIGNHDFANINGLHNFYDEIAKQKERLKLVTKKEVRKFSLLSYLLNKKIKELELNLGNIPNQPLKIGGKIYNRHQNTFIDIYSNLICLEKYHLN